MFIPFMFIIASHAESLSFKLASFYVLCFLARDSRSKAGHIGVMSFVAVSSSRKKQYHNLHYRYNVSDWLYQY